MQSGRFLKAAREIAKKDRQLFDALLEFEETRKIRSKTRLNFTIDKSVASRFRKFCRERGYNMSAKVENIMKELIERGK